MTESSQDFVDIRPEVNILGVLKYINYDAWYALAEFVDNALASYLAHHELHSEPLVVEIDSSTANGGEISIKDNAAGIPYVDFPRAFRAAQVPPDRSGLSEFGMGMKTAATWFANEWSLRTSAIGDPVAREVHFDLTEIVQRGQDRVTIVQAPAAESAHFTRVRLRKLNHRLQTRTLHKVGLHLSGIYRRFLLDGRMRIRLNDSWLEPPTVEVLSAPPAWEPQSADVVWRKNIALQLDDGRSVTGWAAVRKKASTSEAGFALFRRDRLIVGSGDDTYRPVEIFKKSTSFIYQRLFGELDLHGFEVSHTKDGLRWGEAEEEFLLRLGRELSAEPVDLLRQASEYRVRPAAPDIRPAVRAGTRAVAGALAGRDLGREHEVAAVGRVILTDQVQQHGVDAPSAAVESNAPLPSQQRVSSYIANQPREVPAVAEVVQLPKREPVIEPVSFDMRVGVMGTVRVTIWSFIDETDSDWNRIKVTRSADIECSVGINFAHPLCRQYLEVADQAPQMLIQVACALGLAAVQSQAAGYDAAVFLRYFNDDINVAFKPVADLPLVQDTKAQA